MNITTNCDWDQHPQRGQFVAVWFHKGKVWSLTFRYDPDGRLEMYCPDTDSWLRHVTMLSTPGPFTFITE